MREPGAPMDAKIPAGLSAKVLSQLLVMQSLVGTLPDEESIFSFLCRGFSDLPGVAAARFAATGEEISEPARIRFPLRMGQSYWGELLLEIADPAAFAPYEAYLANFCFMLAVILEERHQRRLNEQHKAKLEDRVQERTRQLTEEIAERRRLNRLYAALSQVNQSMVRARNREEFLQEVCRAVVEFGQFSLAWIGWLDPETSEVRPVAQAGGKRDYVRNLRIYADSRAEGLGPTGSAIRECKTKVCNDFFEDMTTLPWREAAAAEGILSSAAFPIRIKGEVAGCLTVYSNELDFFRDKEIALLEETAVSISFDLDHLETESERKMAEEALRKQEAMLSEVIRSVPQSIFWKDRNSVYLGCNDVFARTIGLSDPKMVVGKTDFDLPWPQNEAESYRKDDQTVMESCQPIRHIIEPLQQADGSRLWIDTTKIPMRDADGRVNGILGIYEDITERKRAEVERRQLQEQLIQAQKMEAVGQLAGGVAHDFNNILAVLMMNFCLLQGKPNLDREVRETLAELVLATERAAGLTRQLLMFSRRSVLEIRVLDLNEIVANLLKMLDRLIGEDIDLQFLRQTALPAVEVDPGMLEQVIMNLCVNARDSMPNGGRICLTTETVEVSKGLSPADRDRRPGTFVCLSVADTGCGMDEGTLQRIFEPFFTTKEIGKGTGLGLAMVHGIITQHQGWVEVESQLGKGTTFRVFVPASGKSATVAGEGAPSKSPKGHETILLVEDDRSVRESIVRIQRGLGYQVLEAGNGQEAMRLWQEHRQKVDLLFTDMVMPEGITGLELAERLRAEKPELKIIISSGNTSALSKLTNTTATGIVYLPKPYQASLLAEKLRECLDRR